MYQNYLLVAMVTFDYSITLKKMFLLQIFVKAESKAACLTL